MSSQETKLQETIPQDHILGHHRILPVLLAMRNPLLSQMPFIFLVGQLDLFSAEGQTNILKTSFGAMVILSPVLANQRDSSNQMDKFSQSLLLLGMEAVAKCMRRWTLLSATSLERSRRPNKWRQMGNGAKQNVVPETIVVMTATVMTATVMTGVVMTGVDRY